MARTKLAWQSKTVLLLVLPYAGAAIVLQLHWWTENATPVAVWSLGLSVLLGLVVYQLRAATAGAAAAGAAITASLMFSTAHYPYAPWQTALPAILAVFLLSFAATRLGRAKKERLGVAEKRSGRKAAQVAANLGVAALAADALSQGALNSTGWFQFKPESAMPLFAVGLAALAEAAADTVSSEVGQVLGRRPRMITTMRLVDAGTDGGVSAAGTLAGALAAAAVAATGALTMSGGWAMAGVSWAGGVFGLLFDSLLGATLERRGWLNNDAVNFLSTASAALFAVGALAVASKLHLT